MKNEFVRVDEWVCPAEDAIISYDGKLIVVPFDKIFKRDNIAVLNSFIIKKESYVSKLANITHYMNYFIKFYDTNHELIMGYLRLKYMIDNKDKNIKLVGFIRAVYSILFTESMKEKITHMVEDNYYIDLTAKDDKKYNESLEFTEDHAKLMMKISISMRLMTPVMFHYINANAAGKVKNRAKDKTAMHRFYEGLFGMFDDDIDLYNKLWISIWARVNVNYLRNKLMWEQREIFGVDPLTYTDELLKDKIITDTMFKYAFDKNIISFTYVIIDNQLGYFLREKYENTRVEVSTSRDGDGLSGLDILEMNASKLDEGIVIMSELNIERNIQRIESRMHTNITDEEVDYYIKHTKITKFQSKLVFYFYAKYFYGYRDLNMLTRVQYMRLTILLKKRLQYQGNVYLPQVLTAIIDSRLNTRTIQNNKFLTKIESSSIYQSLMNDKFSPLSAINKEKLPINLLSTILNTTFKLVDYDMEEEYGTVIEMQQDVVSDEFLNFLNQI